MITHNDLLKEFTNDEIKTFLMVGTAVRPNNLLQIVVNELGAKNIVEIGTAKGMSALVMASCDSVMNLDTFDIKRSTVAVDLWKRFNVCHKIHYHVRDTSEEIYEIIDNLEFDFAYVDGDHTYEIELNDFNKVKRCGRVLFDDYDGYQIEKIVTDAGGRKLEDRFGIWLKNGDYSIVDKISKMNLWKEPKNITGNILKLNFEHLIKYMETR